MLFYSVVVFCLFAFFPQFTIYGKNAYSVSLCFQDVKISEDLFIY